MAVSLPARGVALVTPFTKERVPVDEAKFQTARAAVRVEGGIDVLAPRPRTGEGRHPPG